MLPPIKGFIKSSLIEWEGKLVSVLFLPGCNLRCPFCHSPHLVGQGAVLESIPFESVKEFWTAQRDWIDGVVVSGGEPLMHENFEDLLIEIKALGLDVKLDTNGVLFEHLRKLVKKKLVDYVAMDVKAPLTRKYNILAGREVDTDDVRASIRFLMDEGVPSEFRTTVVSTLLDAADVIEIAKVLHGARRYVLQEFRPKKCLDASLARVRPYSRSALREMARMASEYVTTFLRGEGREYEIPKPGTSVPG